jgi:hypothetical protein
MHQKLESFHRRCTRFITGQHIRQEVDGSWTYPNSQLVLKEAGLLSVKEYIESRKARVLLYAKEGGIYKRCQESTPLLNTSGNRVPACLVAPFYLLNQRLP